MVDGLQLLYDTGFPKSINDVRVSDKRRLLSALIDYHLMVKVKAEMDQYREGLQTLGFLEVLKSNPGQWQSYFVAEKKNLTAGIYISVQLLLQRYLLHRMPKRYVHGGVQSSNGFKESRGAVSIHILLRFFG